MKNNQRSSSGLAPLLIALAGLVGVAVGACKQDDGDESDASLEVKNACDDYCDKAVQCNDETNIDKCRSNCIDAMTDCQVDEQDAALTKLDQCANESCDDFIGCSVKVGAQCFFGL